MRPFSGVQSSLTRGKSSAKHEQLSVFGKFPFVFLHFLNALQTPDTVCTKERSNSVSGVVKENEEFVQYNPPVQLVVCKFPFASITGALQGPCPSSFLSWHTLDAHWHVPLLGSFPVRWVHSGADRQRQG
jgi:hypothetical protein